MEEKPKFLVIVQGPPGLTRAALCKVVFDAVVSYVEDAELSGDSSFDVPSTEASLWLSTHPIDVSVTIPK